MITHSAKTKEGLIQIFTSLCCFRSQNRTEHTGKCGESEKNVPRLADLGCDVTSCFHPFHEVCSNATRAFMDNLNA